MKPSVGIFGFGRFGALWANILKNDFDVAVSDISQGALDRAESAGLKIEDTQRLLDRDVIFYAVPISSFRCVLSSHLELLAQRALDKLFIDLLSVKVFPKKIFDEVLPVSARAMLTHPLFGPDSVKSQDLSAHRIVLDQFRASDQEFAYWSEYFRKRGLTVLPMSAEEHDRLAAESQGLTHAIGRTLGEFNFSESAIDTLGARRLMEVKNQVCNDTWELFRDLQIHNPFTAQMRERLGVAQRSIFKRLLPERVFTDRVVIGLQGGRGSFNEEAARWWIKERAEPAYEFKYLYTTANVLRALDRGEIDIGQFAICNSVGGIVHESVEAMGEYTFSLMDEFSISISHVLMMHAESSIEEIEIIMAHPQALKQCERNLRCYFPLVKLSSGEGNLIDASEVALRLGRAQLSKNVAVLGCRALAPIHGLKIVRERLQDDESNRTTFVWVGR